MPTLNADSAPAIDTKWLSEHLKAQSPRLIWRKGDEAKLRELVETDAAGRAFYELVMRQADGIVDLPPLEREMEGRRLLAVARNALKRSTHLAFAWRMTKERRYLDRLETLLDSVSSFSDWNPSHFLDVAEMSLGVAIALDWTGEALSPETQARARTALLEKGLRAGDAPEWQDVFSSDNNWNQVCNAGMVAAALVLAEEEPEHAARAIRRMVETLPNVLETYGPDGVYVEGAMYWSYGTEFNVVLYDILNTALGTDFGLTDAAGFMESADFVQLLRGPTGDYFDFYDSQKESRFMGAQLWFAMKTGQPRYALKQELLELADWDLAPGSHSGRLMPVELLWYSRYEEGKASPLPLNWVGRGENPIGIFRSAFEDPAALYLAFKGGKASNNHGNMDAGSFIFELDGVRWAIDPGNQSYHQLEQYFAKTGGSLWATDQGSVRWDLLTKNNFGHNTLTIDGELHQASGMAEIERFDAEKRQATVDMSDALGPKAIRAERRFKVLDDETIQVTDRLELAEDAEEVRWQLMTQAEVDLYAGQAILRQGGKAIRLEALSPEGAEFSLRSFSLPPHPMDKRMGGLKRIDLIVPSYLKENGVVELSVRISAHRN